jgi:prepilin signal peptidase PulO-like enzyme (type II secretory pathway)
MIEFVYFWPFALALGLVIGSFLNVCIYRIPAGLSVAKGHSMCPACAARLRAADLVPVFSYLVLRGKCRHCGAPVSRFYILVELLTGGLFLLSFYVFGISLQTLVAWIAISALVTATFIDFNTLEIPDGVSIVLAVAGALSFFLPNPVWWDRLLGAAAAAGPLLLIHIFSKGRAMGMGDVKLMAAAGLMLGIALSFFALFAAVIFGAVLSLFLLAFKFKKGKDEIPFVPMLSFGIIFSMFLGGPIVSWYLSFL